MFRLQASANEPQPNSSRSKSNAQLARGRSFLMGANPPMSAATRWRAHAHKISQAGRRQPDPHTHGFSHPDAGSIGKLKGQRMSC
jgi:hypothetical protein